MDIRIPRQSGHELTFTAFAAFHAPVRAATVNADASTVMRQGTENSDGTNG